MPDLHLIFIFFLVLGICLACTCTIKTSSSYWDWKRRTGAVACLTMALVMLILGAYQRRVSSQVLNYLSTHFEIYPNAHLVMSAGNKSWLFKTTDKPESVEAFYAKHVRAGDSISAEERHAHRVITIKNEKKQTDIELGTDSEGTTIVYRILAAAKSPDAKP